MDAAIVYARRGWPVFPCHGPAGPPGGCSCHRPDCASPAKHPRVAGGLKSATTDTSQVWRWWARWPAANIALRTGEVSGLVVLDVDPDHGGDDSLDALRRDHGALPPCRTIRTGSGGRHLYFAHPGRLVRNDAGRRLGPGLDVRGDGGYVIAPPSRHATGGQYAVETDPALIPQLPGWLLEALRAAEPPRARFPQTAEVTAPSKWARAALDGELHRLGAAAEGTRNDTLNCVAFRLGQIVAAGGLQEPEVEEVLVQGALAIGLGEREALATIHSGLRAGERVPRGSADVGVELGP